MEGTCDDLDCGVCAYCVERSRNQHIEESRTFSRAGWPLLLPGDPGDSLSEKAWIKLLHQQLAALTLRVEGLESVAKGFGVLLDAIGRWGDEHRALALRVEALEERESKSGTDLPE